MLQKRFASDSLKSPDPAKVEFTIVIVPQLLPLQLDSPSLSFCFRLACHPARKLVTEFAYDG